ncbi:tail fiber protein [Loktanella sp. 3ANDIMAR09]|uniref:tail fiber protein n=1 Tax=Loktanella sp. 3ANDIMAR09 TaxID=1225657 RepID=UPI0006FA4B6F|nr:tail fiber protein [Loktanella sp. 3ANDIMAR09]
MPATIIFTDLGLAKVNTASGSEAAVVITEVALGDGGGALYDPTTDQVSLRGEVIRRPFDRRAQTEASSWMINAVFPSADLPAMTLREVGFFDQDGDLIVVAAGLDYPTADLGAYDFVLDQTITLDRVAEGAIIVEGPDWPLVDHIAEDLAAHAIFTQALAQAAERIVALERAQVPIGTLVDSAGPVAPDGWMTADGRALARDEYPELWAAIGDAWGAGDGATTFNIPELRTEFRRGADLGRGELPALEIGTWQADEIREHSHPLDGAYNEDNGNNAQGPNEPADGRLVTSTLPFGGEETRPRAVSVHPIIRVR